MHRSNGNITQFGIMLDKGNIDAGDPVVEGFYKLRILVHVDEDILPVKFLRGSDESVNGGPARTVPEKWGNDR